jgi:toxin ParE1/3/4
VRRVTRADAADRDLDEILEYLTERSPPAAERLVADLDSRSRLLATQPRAGRPRNDLAPGLRSIVVGRYVVFFVSTDDEVIIVRIIHGARNITPEMFTGG